MSIPISRRHFLAGALASRLLADAPDCTPLFALPLPEKEAVLPARGKVPVMGVWVHFDGRATIARSDDRHLHTQLHLTVREISGRWSRFSPLQLLKGVGIGAVVRLGLGEPAASGDAKEPPCDSATFFLHFNLENGPFKNHPLLKDRTSPLQRLRSEPRRTVFAPVVGNGKPPKKPVVLELDGKGTLSLHWDGNEIHLTTPQPAKAQDHSKSSQGMPPLSKG